MLLSCIFKFLLSFIFLPDRFINDTPLLLQPPYSAEQIYEFKMAASFWALVSQATLLVCFFFIVSVQLAIIQHVDSDEVGHFIVHFFAFTQLKCQVFIIFIFVAALWVFNKFVKQKLCWIFKNIWVYCHQRKLAPTIHDMVSCSRIVILFAHSLNYNCGIIARWFLSFSRLVKVNDLLLFRWQERCALIFIRLGLTEQSRGWLFVHIYSLVASGLHAVHVLLLLANVFMEFHRPFFLVLKDFLAGVWIQLGRLCHIDLVGLRLNLSLILWLLLLLNFDLLFKERSNLWIFHEFLELLDAYLATGCWNVMLIILIDICEISFSYFRRLFVFCDPFLALEIWISCWRLKGICQMRIHLQIFSSLFHAVVLGQLMDTAELLNLGALCTHIWILILWVEVSVHVLLSTLNILWLFEIF